MMKKCPRCGGRVLTASMTEAEEPRYAAAFRCASCEARFLETWPDGRERKVQHVAIDEK
jgi:DNA-directed RNA polymerase subunit RPC12/RpoP